MNKIIFLFIFLILNSGCSFNSNSKFWTKSENIVEENYKKIFAKKKVSNQELNSNIKIDLKNTSENDDLEIQYYNNDGRYFFDGKLKRSTRYKFSKIKNFYQFEPTISFNKENIIFFDNKGSIIQFDNKSKLVWKKNYYSKFEKKLNPILQFANNSKFLVVADNLAKYYMIDLSNGKLIWSKNNDAPFNSQIKIYKDKFFVIDFSNTLRCFSIKDGSEIWSIKTENSLIRSQKKLSMVFVDEKIYFNNSVGDISAVDVQKGELLWQLPTQSSLIYESAFSLETSDLITDSQSLFFSNNKNEFFSIDLDTGSFNWKNKVNSNLRPSIIDNYLFTISMEGFLIIIEKKTGNIIRITNIFNNFKPKKRNNIKPTGFIVGFNKIYLSTSNGKLLIIDIKSGKTISTLKIDNEKVSRPIINDKNLFLIKDNAIIKLN